MSPLDNYYEQKEEPVKSCLLFMRQHILKHDKAITEEWKYGMPFFCYNGKMCCYLWIHKKYLKPYLGIVEGAKVKHPDLVQEKRARMKILILDAYKDLPLADIDHILGQMLKLYRQ